MKTRSEIKSLAKESFRSRYWVCVGAYVLYSLINFALCYTFIGELILAGPLAIGLNFLFVQVFLGAEVNIGTMFSKAFEDFGRKLGGYLWMLLFVVLWSLIPLAGIIIVIIKAYAYSMTCYILCDCPNVKAKEALKLSMRMMHGHKWQYFVFQLSFIGWHLLNGLTCGLLGIFWLNPYAQSAYAGFYLELREQCLREGVITPAELDGTCVIEE